jgi:1,4-dihydroxy-2-naphthoate octaprenyltransferase
LPRHLALIGAWIALCVGGAFSIVAAWMGVLNLVSLFVLAFGAFFGWMYSLPPLALAWRGWGELDNALIGSVALPLYGYVVHSDRFDWAVILACLPFFGLAFTNLLATTWADREADTAVGKCTLATSWPVIRLRLLYITVVAGSFSLLLLLHSWGFPPIVVWSSFLVLPVAIWGMSTYTRISNPFPSVAAMVLMLFVQLVAWWSMADFCCLMSVIGSA